MNTVLKSMLLWAALHHAASAQALTLDIIGPTYPVTEPHFLDDIVRQLQEKEKNGELNRLQQEAKTRSIAYITRPPAIAGLSRTRSGRTFYYDPSFTLDRNIFDDKGRILFAAGMRKNPLEIVSLSKHLLFFDGRDPQQVTFARSLTQHYSGQLKPILVGGSYLSLMKQWQQQVFYDQRGLLTYRFGITHVPALVSQEGLRLRIDELEVTR